MKKKDGHKKITSLGTFFLKSVRFFYEKAIRPHSESEDIRRKEFLISIVLIASLILVGMSNVLVLIRSYDLGSEYTGVPFYITFGAFIFFLFLYVLARKGYLNISSYSLIWLLLFLNVYAIEKWSIQLPAALMGLFLVVAISSILVNAKFSFLITTVISSIVVIFGYLQAKGNMPVDLEWQKGMKDMDNSIEFIVMFWVVAILSWLSNREMEKSLKRARNSEAELKKERDLLEVKVRERTDQLKVEHMKHISQLSRFVDFGKLSSGLFHDLLNHLTVFFLNYEQATKTKEELESAKKYYTKVLKAKEEIEKYISTVRKQLQEQETENKFSLKEEIDQIIEMLSYKARIKKIEIKFFPQGKVVTCGNVIKFNHVITNIISNAIDAYDGKEEKEDILVHLSKKAEQICISIEDFGMGIKEENIGRIFEPFFSTKGVSGSGIGLATAKEIIENDFKGSLVVKSIYGKGSVFEIKFPLKEKNGKVD